MNNGSKETRRCGVLAGGNWIIDHVKMIDAWPAQDALATIGTQSDGNGGCPYNLLKNLAKMQCGFPLTGVGLIGNDADGQRILNDCDAHGIDRSGLQPCGTAATSYTDVMTVAASGRRTFFHQQGANALLNYNHFDLGCSTARLFCLGYLGLLQTLDALDEAGRTPASRLFEQARKHGMVTVADLVSNEIGDFPAVINPSLPHLDFLFLNEYELSRLAGLPEATKDPARVEQHARLVMERGVTRAVVVHFPEGALCVRRDDSALWQGSVCLRPDLIAGTAGAGDAFGAGFVLGIHEGWELERCLELAVCVAAVSLREATCSNAIKPWQDCLQSGRKLGFN